MSDPLHSPPGTHQIQTKVLAQPYSPHYQLLPQPRTKPPRFLLAEDDTILARNLTKSVGRQIIASLLLSKSHPELFNPIHEAVKNSGV